MPTPTGYAPDGPPAIYNDPAPNATVAGSQSFTAATILDKVIARATIRNDSPLVTTYTNSFSTIAAPASFTNGPAAQDTSVPV